VVLYELKVTIQDQLAYVKTNFAIMRLPYDELLININKLFEDTSQYLRCGSN
jgi:hypothetical protein